MSADNTDFTNFNTFPSIEEQNKKHKGIFDKPNKQNELNAQYLNNANNFPDIHNSPDIPDTYNLHDFPDFPDYVPNFSEKIDIESDSVNLALSTLNMTKAEYNGMSINDLKNLKRSNFINSNASYSINILIYYKQNSKNSLFPNISPIQHITPNLRIPQVHLEPNTFSKNKKNILSTKNFFENSDSFAKIYPEFN